MDAGLWRPGSALCCPATRTSLGPASIAPFLAGLGRPPALPGSSCGRARVAGYAARAHPAASQPSCRGGWARGGLQTSKLRRRCAGRSSAARLIGSNCRRAVERGDGCAIDSCGIGKRANLRRCDRRGATLSVTDVRDAAAIRSVFEQARPERRLSPRGAGRRARLGRGSARRRRRQRARDDHGPRSRAGRRGHARRQQLDRRRPVRRRQGDPDARGCPGRHSADGSRTVRASSPPRAYRELFARLHGFSTISLRYGNVYGPRQDINGEAVVVANVVGAGHRRIPAPCRRRADPRHRARSRRVRARSAPDSPASPAVRYGDSRETSVLDLIDALAAAARGTCAALRAR